MGLGYVMSESVDEWVSEWVSEWLSDWEMYLCHTNQIGATINNQSNGRL